MAKRKKSKADKVQIYEFSDREKLDLLQLNERMLLASHQTRTLVGFFAKERGIDLEKNKVSFDLEKMVFSVEPNTQPSVDM